MKVKELIEELQRFDEDMEVRAEYDCYASQIREVSIYRTDDSGMLDIYFTGDDEATDTYVVICR